MYKNQQKKLPESKPLSSSVINPHLQQMNKSKKDNYNPNQSLNAELLKQSMNDFPDQYDHQINNVNSQNKQQKIRNNQKFNISYFQNRQASQASSFIFNQNPMKFSTNQNQLYESLQTRNLQKYIKNQNFDKIRQSQIFQEDEKEHSMPNKSKSARNLRNINEKKLKISSEIENIRNGKQFIPVKKQKKSLNQNLQHKVIYQNFRLSDLNFLSDQQFLPQGMYPEALVRKNSSKNNSRKSESNHPVFRQTLEYVDSKRHNIEQNLMEIDAQSRQISDQSSQSSMPLTNIDDKLSYKERYRKYKHKYNSSVNVIKQFQKLNETLINDQRQNLHYYQNTIKDLQNLLMVKDKEIDQLNHILMNTRIQEENYSQRPFSIDGRQIQAENQKLKKQLENKNIQINRLKQKIGSVLSQSRVGQQKRQGFNQNIQKKHDILKKQKESLSKKITTLEELNKIYESKFKEKQQRLSKLSELNSQLQEQIIKLKSKMHSDETYDTERSFVQDFSKKNKKENLTFSTQTFSKYPIVSSQQKMESPSQIEKYISCIDQQLQLIRSSIIKEKGDDNSKNMNSINQFRKKDLSELDSVSQFQFEDEVQYKIPFKVLQNVVQKLSNFRASMGV